MASNSNPKLRLYNSLGRSLEEFEPFVPGRVRLYSCGLTVYNYAHIGNLRAYLFADTLRRILQWKGYDVFHVINITDVGHLTSDADEGDDKVEAAARSTGRTVWDITRYYTEDFKQSLARLNVQEPALWPKATEHIQEMIAFARDLEAAGYTYELPDGLYFDTSKVSDYGKLGLLDLEGQQEGARVDSKGDKRNGSDFAVWRRSPEDEQRLMEWDSPWGRGAPGWHLECSVMSLKYLGAPFDIHTGGVDHRQVHHCNEIAQNQGAARGGDGSVRFWMHNEFLLLEDLKMSKSTGEFIRLQTVEGWGIHPLVYRYFNLMAHYRSQLEFSASGLIAAKTGLQRLARRVQALRAEAGELPWEHLLADARFTRGGAYDYVITSLAEPLDNDARAVLTQLDEALSNDLNTAAALAAVSQAVNESSLSPDAVLRLVAIAELALGLRLLDLRPEELNLRPGSASLTDEEVTKLVEEREASRQHRNFERADAIRDQLTAAGVEIMDTRDGTPTAWSWNPAIPIGD